MKKTLAIASLTLRTAVRSRVFAVLVVLVLICITGLPFILKSDGTLTGIVQLYLHYALGLTMALLSIAAVWAGCGAFSLEVESHEIQLLVTKPVWSVQLWLGKWLGLMAMNAVLLGLAGTLVYGMLRWSMRPARLTSEEQRELYEEILVARKELLPEFRRSKSDSSLPGATQESRVVVPPGGKHQWRFKIPARLVTGDAVFLKFRFVTSRVNDSSPVTGMWTIGPGSDSGRVQILKASEPNAAHQLKIPASAVIPGQVLSIAYSNIDSVKPVSILFSAKGGVKLLLRQGGFVMNYARALMVLLARLSFFSALGLAAGALFSFPVAVFTSFAFLISSWISRFIERVAVTGLSGVFGSSPAGSAAVVWQHITQYLFVFMNLILPPLSRFEPLSLLQAGTFISWSFVGKAFVIFIVAYTGILGLISAWLFSRRELGLPG